MNINEWKKLILRGNILYDSNYRTLEKAKKKRNNTQVNGYQRVGGRGEGLNKRNRGMFTVMKLFCVIL